MKHTILKALAMIALPLAVACGNGKTENKDAGSEQQPAAEQPAVNSSVAEAAAAGKIDPICEMEKDASWTEFSVHKGDTIWFCGEGCKQAFDARPEKYMGTKG